ncbi:hypothetical protein LLG95_04780 [bacterium]|nr:hypothetical protein [bacterium]
MSKPAPKHLNCPTCGEPGELPFLFCDKCGVPRVRLGHWRLVLNLSFAFGTFMAIYLARDFLAWSWPLYAWFWIFYIQFGLMLMAGRAGLKLRLLTWNLVFFLGFFTMFHFMQPNTRHDFLFFFLSPGQPLAPDFLLTLLGTLPGIANENPIPFFIVLGIVVVLVFGSLYILWGRRYGWVNSYRLVILSLIAICTSLLLVLRIAEYLHGHGYYPNVNLQDIIKAKPDYDFYVGWADNMLWRVFLIEIVGYSAIHSYAMVHKKPMPPIEIAPGESPLIRSLLRLIMILQRLYRVFEQMFLYLLGTLGQLARDMWLVFKAFMRELAVPSISLIATALMFYALMHITMDYIETDQAVDIGKILLLFAGTLFSLVLFVGCKTPYRWGRLLTFYGEMLAWLLPNLIVFFLIMSLSLWMSARVLSSHPQVSQLPYRMGLLTEILAGIMFVMLIVTLIRKRALIAQPPEEPAHAETAAAPKEKRKFPRPKIGFGGLFQWGGLNRVAEKAKQKAGQYGLEEKARRARGFASEAAGFIKDRIHGKPLVVEKLERATERFQEKMAQVSTLSNMQASVDAHTYQRLMTQYRNELKLLKAEREEVLLEYSRTLDRRREEMAGLTAESAQLATRRQELEALQEAGALNASDYKRECRALEAETQALNVKLEACQAIIDSMATEATETS